jgi:sugar phosphate isomerase/epimerase
MSPPDPARLALNTVTVRERWNLQQAIEGCRRHGIGGITVWRQDLADLGLAAAARLLKTSGLTVTGLARGGPYPYADAAQRDAAIEDTLRGIDEAAQLEARCLILVVGGLAPGSKDLAASRAMVRDAIGGVLDHALRRGVALALEPFHPMYCADRSCISTLRQANALCDELGPGLGIAVDVYHVWWDPELEAEFRRAGQTRLLALHLSDWLVPTTDLVLDRGMMGDGIIDIPRIRRAMEANGFSGFHEVEIFSARNWWRRDPDEVLDICRQRHRTHC